MNNTRLLLLIAIPWFALFLCTGGNVILALPSALLIAAITSGLA